MRWREDKDAAARSGRDIREFVNGGLVRSETKPPDIAPEFALWWAKRVRQVGTRKTGRMSFVELFFEGGSERMREDDANTALKAVQRYRFDLTD